MLARARTLAATKDRPTVAVTFNPHPAEILQPGLVLPRLSTISARTELLRQFGADEVVVLPVDRQLLGMTSKQFFNEVLVDRFSACGMVEGPDFRFGRDREGDTEVLRRLCSAQNMTLTVIEAVRTDAELISSSRIRRMLTSGDFDHAVNLLGHPYLLSGRVTPGAGRGRTMGFPTANLSGIETLLPANGVYAGRCTVAERSWQVAVSIGPNPTFDDQTQKVECHIVDYSGSLYGQLLDVELLAKIRDLHAFADAAALITAIRADIQRCREFARAE